MNIKIKSIFKGEVKRKLYRYCVQEIETYYETIEWRTICVCDIDMPLLEIGHSIYINEIDELVIIDDIVRDSSGSVTYCTNKTVEEIEDFETGLSLEYAQKERDKDKLKKIKNMEELDAIIEAKKVKSYRREISDLKFYNKKWYQFWK